MSAARPWSCVDWFDWDIWVTTEPGPCGDFGSLLLRRGL